MKKQLIKLMFTALTFGMLMSLNTMATDAETNSAMTEVETDSQSTQQDNNIVINESGKISLISDDSKLNGITAIQLSLKIEPEYAAKISFDFNHDNDIKVYDFRYHEDSQIMNIYIADSNPIFNDGTDLLDIGKITATDDKGNNVNVYVEAVEDSLKLVSQNTLVEKRFDTTTEEETGDNILKLNKEYATAYMITIPSGTDTLKADDTFTLSADNVLLEYGKNLKVSVTSENNWTLKDKKHSDNTVGIGYQMGYGNDKTEITDNKKTVLSVGEGAKSGAVTLTVLSVDKAKMAGTFADTLTFEIEVAS